jgi:spore germination protein GerM
MLRPASICLRVIMCASLFLAALPPHFSLARTGTEPDYQGLEEILPGAAERDFPVYLYFVDTENGYLNSEARDIQVTRPPQAFCREIVKELIRGPETGLVKTLPPGTELRALYVTSDRVAYVDLSASVSDDHPGGVRTELMTVYSIVNTLVLNVSAVERVKLLIDGRDADTLAGHIDIRHPLQADMLLVR